MVWGVRGMSLRKLSNLKGGDPAYDILNCVLIDFKVIKMNKKIPNLALDIGSSPYLFYNIS